MKRALLPLAALLTALVTVGSAVPAASAASDRNGGKATITKTNGGKVATKLATDQRTLLSLIATKDRALAKAAQSVTRAELAVGETEVLSNIRADRDALVLLRSAATATTTLEQVRLLSQQVHAIRPEIYSVVTNGLRQAAAFQTEVPANTTAIDETGAHADARQLDGYDVTGVRTLITEATLANDEALALAGTAIAKGLLLSATSTDEERTAFTADIAAAGERLDAIRTALQLAAETLAAMVPAEDPVLVVDPATTEPVSVTEPAL